MAQVNSQTEKINSLIMKIKNKFAPDKRTALFNVELKKSNGNLYLIGETNIPEAKTKLIDELKKESITIKDSIELLPSKKLGDKIFGVINLSVSNSRSNPEHPAELSTQSLLGTPIKILKKVKGGYYLIQTPDKYLSYLDDDGFQIMNNSEWQQWKNSEKIIYIKEFGWAYQQPDENSQHISDLVAGNILKLLSEDEKFFRVEFPDKRIAYVLKSEASNFRNWYNTLKPTEENIIKTAFRFMGVPYLWGGTSSKGMDCSGFTKTVYFLNGIILPRDASQQVFVGELINTEANWSNLKPGDLLFFGTKATNQQNERITHVAIYIGDGDFIHAAGRVRVDSFDKSKPYYSYYREATFIRAKRILSSIGKNGVEQILNNNFYKP